MSPAINLSPSKLAHMRVLVLGAGDTGVAIATWLTEFAAKVVVADSRPSPDGAKTLMALGINCRLSAWVDSSNNINTPSPNFAWLEDFDFVAISPGIAPSNSIVQAINEKSLPIVGEMALFMDALQEISPQAKVLGITGSNGKTTTTTLVGKYLEALNKTVAIAGNIRPPALARLMTARDKGVFPDYWVLELSSFQLAYWNRGELAAGAILNLSDNHLDWHDSIANYAACKQRLLMFAKTWVINVADPKVIDLAKKLTVDEAHANKTCHTFSLAELADTLPHEKFEPAFKIQRHWYEHNGVLGFSDNVWNAILSRKSSPLLGAHNSENILAALALVSSVHKLSASDINVLTRATEDFHGIAHRMELVATWQGIDFINDSKSTTVASTLAALMGLQSSIILLAGGVGKNQDFSPLKEAVKAKAKHVLLFGFDAPLINKCLSGLPCKEVADMTSAVTAALKLASAGDQILLSPACASFDQFKNYEDRGEKFCKLVKQVTKKSQSSLSQKLSLPLEGERTLIKRERCA